MKTHKYYSQWNQDAWLTKNIFKDKENGTFIDCGASDGICISNTYFFETCLNWSGICIEPRPEMYTKLVKNRSSICVNSCAYNKDGVVEFDDISGYCDSLSGIKTEYCNNHKQRINREMTSFGGEIKTIKSPSFRIETLCDRYNITHVDYLSIDTEGSELAVLEGINFDKVTIDIIEVEVNYPEDEKKLGEYLVQKGYKFVTKLGGDNVYGRTGFLESIKWEQL